MSRTWSCADLFPTSECAYALRAEEISPPEAGLPKMTSICFSTGPLGQSDESRGGRLAGSEGNRGGLDGNMPNLSSLLLGGAGGCPRGCSAQGRFDLSRLLATSISTVMYWCACCSISGSIAGDHSISDQKNLDGLSPVKNAWMARDGWRSGIP
ncbi:hypothetical protein B296_00024927 [Ensete ventricosum]|uniref:Uncharacterized protein n=1 Tax=Ensete ventricosum TaxID=4639 RepID=A0A426Y8U6_ENSVE|nr:hypothetical protein B296_00024927 [Ensete ventricosum]